ncbi:MAG TPA: hypothetical protein VF221_17580, partial [Chloroflexota bacterium]
MKRQDMGKGMKSVRLLGLLFALGLAVSTAPAYADGTASHSKAVVNWQQRDTAVYVVSTLNLLNRSRSHTMQQVLQGLGVTHIDVYADNARPDLYFIELMHDDGIAGS